MNYEMLLTNLGKYGKLGTPLNSGLDGLIKALERVTQIMNNFWLVLVLALLS